MQHRRNIYTGEHEGYHWLVAPDVALSQLEVVLQFHQGLRLCITSYDSGVIRPNDSETAVGWTMRRDVMVSPPLTSSLEIPHDQYDEWYILDSPTFADDKFEVFVNYGGFTLRPPEETYKTFDPTWDKTGLSHLAQIQDRFWSQLARICPETYIAMGDLDVIVSRNQRFLGRLQIAAAELE
jgi:hypothetical protein